MADAAETQWFSLVKVAPSGTHDAPPLGERLSEDMTALKGKLANMASSSWTTWSTGIPPNDSTDGGWEIDF